MPTVKGEWLNIILSHPPTRLCLIIYINPRIRLKNILNDRGEQKFVGKEIEKLKINLKITIKGVLNNV